MIHGRGIVGPRRHLADQLRDAVTESTPGALIIVRIYSGWFAGGSKVWRCRLLFCGTRCCETAGGDARRLARLGRKERGLRCRRRAFAALKRGLDRSAASMIKQRPGTGALPAFFGEFAHV